MKTILGVMGTHELIFVFILVAPIILIIFIAYYLVRKSKLKSRSLRIEATSGINTPGRVNHVSSFSIGRDANNKIVLNDNLASRRHAELIISDDGSIIIKDLGSTNGTFVNGNRVSECYVKPGDVVRCANSFLNWQQYLVQGP